MLIRGIKFLFEFSITFIFAKFDGFLTITWRPVHITKGLGYWYRPWLFGTFIKIQSKATAGCLSSIIPQSICIIVQLLQATEHSALQRTPLNSRLPSHCFLQTFDFGAFSVLDLNLILNCSYVIKYWEVKCGLIF